MPQAELVLVPSKSVNALKYILDGRADVAMADSRLVYDFIEMHKDKVEDPFMGETYEVIGGGWFVSKEDQSLLHMLNVSISYLEGAGVIRDITSRYDGISLLKSQILMLDSPDSDRMNEK